MAALTAATTTRTNVGAVTLHIFTFTAMTGADTFASGLGTAVVGFWAQNTNPGGSTLVTGVNVSNSSGTFTFQNSVAATPITLYVISTT